MLTKSSITNSYNIDAVIQVGAKLYNVISILEDDPKTSKKLVLDLLKEVEEEKIQDVFGHATVNICENNKRLLTTLLKLINEKERLLKLIENNTFLKGDFFETLVDQSHKVDEDILKSVLYQDIWSG
jgi:indole-3-glycerol phosphate synthase